MSRDESHFPLSGDTGSDTGSDADATDSKAIGARFEARWAEEQLEAAFAASGQLPTSPRSVGVIEVGAEDGRPITALLEDLGPDLTLQIRRSLPRGARLVFAHGARFVLALPGDPLLEALLIVDRVRDLLERQAWSIAGEPVMLVFDGGVSTRHGDDEPLSVTLEAAERSLDRKGRLVIHRHDDRSPLATTPSGTGPAASRPLPGVWSRSLHTDT